MANFGIDGGFIRSRDGILKIVEFIVSLLVLILCSSTSYWLLQGLSALAFVHFTASFICITLLISGLIYMCKLYNAPLCGRLPWKILELGYALLCAALALGSIIASGIIAARNYAENTDELAAAAAVFCAILMVVFLVHAFLMFRGDPPRSAGSHHTRETNVST